jgi:hypothetical protein
MLMASYFLLAANEMQLNELDWLMTDKVASFCEQGHESSVQ